MDSYVYVLGTGSSLLSLSKSEREYLHDHPRTLAINRYYLYYEKLGILPRILFVSDFNYFAALIVRSIVERLHAHGHDIPFFINQAYLDFYQSPWYRHCAFKRSARRLLKRGYDHKPPSELPAYSNFRGFDVANESSVFAWANDLNTPLYHRRGSLSSALNLVNILYPGYSIKLLGIDMSTPEYFYDETVTAANRDQWVDEKYEESLRVGNHACARPKAHDPVTLVDVMRWIVEEYERQKLRIFNCNPESLLVTEGVTSWSPVISD